MIDQPITVDPVSMRMLELARKAARTGVTVLILGETGVGKEVLAQYIHHQSAQHTGPFISVNCAALPANMIEAMLFGYEKGAFTGALTSYEGKFEQAQGGTLLLDEIAEIPLELQAKLLRVLQEREVEKLGSKITTKLQMRVIAATNVDIEQRVQEGLFRRDLYYRLNVFPINCVALRERPQDIMPLIQYFLQKFTQAFALPLPTIAEAAYEKLQRYPWPGNIRELENVIQRALIVTEQDVLMPDAFELPVANNKITELTIISPLKKNEASIILDVLRETDGCRDDAAKKLKISARTLRYKISKLKSIGYKVP